MIIIKKISKATQKIIYEEYENFDTLEKRLSRLSSSHYNMSDFFIVSDDFNSLSSYFKTTYNQNYFSIDDILETISIHKLKVGEKRLRFFKKTPRTNKDIIDKAIKRLQKKYNLNYDEDLSVLEVHYINTRATLEINNNDIKVENTRINGANVDEVEKTLKIAKEIAKYLNKLNKNV